MNVPHCPLLYVQVAISAGCQNDKRSHHGNLLKYAIDFVACTYVVLSQIAYTKTSNPDVTPTSILLQ